MLKIAIVSSEAVPFGKTGGLGDMVTALAKELVKLGNQVTLMMPLWNPETDENICKELQFPRLIREG